MLSGFLTILGTLAALAADPATLASRVNTVIVHNDNQHATSLFQFKVLPSPSPDDAATEAVFSLVDGRPDRNGGALDRLHNGRTPSSSDQPNENFFFAAGSDGGRLLVDLGAVIAVEQINTYSWHSGLRGPQIYTLYASDGKAEQFNAQVARGVDPEMAGWTRVTEVDTQAQADDGDADRWGGQYAVSVFEPRGPLGKYRYLLFDVRPTDPGEQFSHTFYSEIDVVAAEGTADDGDAAAGRLVVEAGDGQFQITIDTAEAPHLTQWAREELAPVVQQWYPRIVDMLPSDEFNAPRSLSITFTPQYRGVAAASGTRIQGSPTWFQRNLDGEAKGAIVHELVHVVQQYGRARRVNREATRPPGWLVEGIPDYIRWFLYEPESRGAEITRRGLDAARHDASYRVSANFLNWVTKTHDAEIIKKLNAALREGNYRDALWKEQAGKTLSELEEQWRAALLEELDSGADRARGIPAAAAAP